MTAGGIFIVAAKRTPFGTFGGALKHLTPTQLGVEATKAALASANISPDLVSAVSFGNVIQSSSDAAYVARHVALQSGCKIDTPAVTINRLCGSGFETIVQAHQWLTLSKQTNCHVVVAGGTENMSNAPLLTYGTESRWGTKLGQGLQLRDALWDGLTDAHSKTPMGVTAENLAKDYHITRAACDEYAVRSQQAWAQAQKDGVFKAEMAPIELKSKKGSTIMDTDEHPRPETTVEKIGKLPPVFEKDGVVTAANSSGICDGAGALILATEAACNEHNWQPLARVVSYGWAGCDPTRMGIGPVPAIHRALAMAGGDLTVDHMDRIEVNEAFAAQTLAVMKELKLDISKTNIHGGAIALGHPLGASGSRIMAHLTHEFAAKPNNKYHLGAACIGGGQGIAVIIERV